MRTKILIFLIGLTIGILLNSITYFDCKECSKEYINIATYTKGIDLYIFGHQFRVLTWK